MKRQKTSQGSTPNWSRLPKVLLSEVAGYLDHVVVACYVRLVCQAWRIVRARWSKIPTNTRCSVLELASLCIPDRVEKARDLGTEDAINRMSALFPNLKVLCAHNIKVQSPLALAPMWQQLESLSLSVRRHDPLAQPWAWPELIGLRHLTLSIVETCFTGMITRDAFLRLVVNPALQASRNLRSIYIMHNSYARNRTDWSSGEETAMAHLIESRHGKNLDYLALDFDPASAAFPVVTCDKLQLGTDTMMFDNDAKWVRSTIDSNWTRTLGQVHVQSLVLIGCVVTMCEFGISPPRGVQTLKTRNSSDVTVTLTDGFVNVLAPTLRKADIETPFVDASYAITRWASLEELTLRVDCLVDEKSNLVALVACPKLRTVRLGGYCALKLTELLINLLPGSNLARLELELDKSERRKAIQVPGFITKKFRTKKRGVPGHKHVIKLIRRQ